MFYLFIFLKEVESNTIKYISYLVKLARYQQEIKYPKFFNVYRKTSCMADNERNRAYYLHNSFL